MFCVWEEYQLSEIRLCIALAMNFITAKCTVIQTFEIQIHCPTVSIHECLINTGIQHLIIDKFKSELEE